MGAAVLTATAAELVRGTRGGGVVAMSDSTATGLIAALGAGGSFLVVLALTIRAARLSNRANRAAAAGQAHAAQARSGRGRTRTRTRTRSRGPGGSGRGPGSGLRTAKADPYPPQPYSAQEPTSHLPYSRPYRVPAQDGQHGQASTNGHHPIGPVGVPTTPWDPSED